MSWDQEDHSRKTAALRELERRLQRWGGSEPPPTWIDPQEIAEVLRSALAESVSDNLPIGRRLLVLIAGLLDGSIHRPRGRPPLDMWEALANMDRALEVGLAVHQRRLELKADGKQRPRQRAIHEVAEEYSIAPDTLETLLKRGPSGMDPAVWRSVLRAWIENRLG